MDPALSHPPAWVADAVFYQVFPDRFARSERGVAPGELEAWDTPPTRHGFKGGDLLGLAEHLDHLTSLGITAIYLNPVFSSASNHRYHTYDYLAVDPLLGGEAALRELLDTAHARGMRVILDGVFNHASRGFWPFHHVMETGRHSPYRDWFYFDADALDAGRQVRAYPDVSVGEALATDRGDAPIPGAQSLSILGYRAWWDLPALPKLNTDNPAVRAYLFAVAEHWIRFGADGWRLDVPGEIADPGFWRELRQRVRAVNPDAYLVAEIWREDPEALAGDRFDGAMNYPLAEALISFVGGMRLQPAIIAQHAELRRMIRPDDAAGFAARLERLLSIYRPETTRAMLNLLDSHDTPRLLTIVAGDRATVLMSWLAVMTLPGAPCIFYGDEIGLPGAHDPDCRRAMPWDRNQWDTTIYAALRAMVALRHAEPVLRHGVTRIVAAEGMAVAYLRGDDDQAPRILVALNAGDGPIGLNVALPELEGHAIEPIPLPGEEGAAEHPAGSRVASGVATLMLPARTGVAYRVD